MTVTDAALAVKVGIYDACAAVVAADPLGPQIGLFWGDPTGPVIPREFLSVTETVSDFEAATMATTRTRDQSVTVYVTIAAHRQGTDAQRESCARAYGLGSALEKHLRDINPATLTPGCWSVFVTHTEDAGVTAREDTAGGRYTLLRVEIVAKVRVTN